MSHQLSKIEQQWLKGLLDELLSRGCSPVVLRNYDDLPTSIGNDLDIYVDAAMLSMAKSVVEESFVASQGGIGHVHERGYFCAIWLDVEGSGNYLHIDLYPGATTWKGLSFLSPNELVANQRNYRVESGWDISVPAQEHEALMLLSLSLLWGGFLKEKYLPMIGKLLSDESLYRRWWSLCKSTYGDGIARELGRLVESSELPSQAATKSLVRRMRRALVWKNIRQRPFRAVLGCLRHWWWELRCHSAAKPGKILLYPRDEQERARERFHALIVARGSLFRGSEFVAVGEASSLRKRLRRWHGVASNDVVALPGDDWAGDWQMTASRATLAEL